MAVISARSAGSTPGWGISSRAVSNAAVTTTTIMASTIACALVIHLKRSGPFVFAVRFATTVRAARFVRGALFIFFMRTNHLLADCVELRTGSSKCGALQEAAAAFCNLLSAPRLM